jgi:ferredoxin
MIITKKRSRKQIFNSLKGSKTVFLIGCAQCATICETGGEDQVNEMESDLQKRGLKITGKAILDPACHLVKVKQLFHKNKKTFRQTDAVLVLACGDGAQAIKDGTKAKKVLPALETLFLGEIERGGHFTQKCILCGECIIDRTGTICPLTICTKGLLNGPCGGSKNEKCEVDKEKDCGWILIYKSLKESGDLDNMRKIYKPLDYSKQLHPQKIIL